jgi:hypothetical protein
VKVKIKIGQESFVEIIIVISIEQRSAVYDFFLFVLLIRKFLHLSLYTCNFKLKKADRTIVIIKNIFSTSTSHSSKCSNRNIDLTFTNIGEIRGETLQMGTSGHCPVIITCENVVFDNNKMFPHVHWKAYEAILTLLQKFFNKRTE